jgi:hypothetical protein
MREPWNGWVHCTGSTYGTWLRGDPRGWRAQKHREHCEGDYRNRPVPGLHKKKLALSRRLQRRPGIHLDQEARMLACAAMLEALNFHNADPIALCVGREHWHALIRGIRPDRTVTMQRTPRRIMGIAKRESARALSRAGLVASGGVWARGCGRRWIKDRQHQVAVVRYIKRHEREGAATWTVIGGNFTLPDQPLIKPA